MKDFLLKDSVLKIVSFVIAILLWFYVIVVVDPAVSVTVSEIPVTPVNTSTLEDNGLTLVDDGNMFVELEIKGSRKKIVNIDRDNISATINLETVTQKGTHSLPISLKVPYQYDEIVKKNPTHIKINVDEVATVEKVINVKKKGTVADGYIAEDYVLKYDKVVLTGAKSVLETIKDVEVELDYNGRTSTISDNEQLYFVLNDGKTVKREARRYKDIEMSITEVNITCLVQKVKSVPVKVDFAGDAEEYRWTVNPGSVTIQAEEDIAKNITEIYTEPIQAGAFVTKNVEVHLVVPEGVVLKDNKTVEVQIERKE